jgi:hypothetical protein
MTDRQQLSPQDLPYAQPAMRGKIAAMKADRELEQLLIYLREGGCISDGSRFSLTAQRNNSTHEYRPDGGITEAMYWFLTQQCGLISEGLTDLEKYDIAHGVIQARVWAKGVTIDESCDVGRALARLGIEMEDLAGVVELQGFDTIADAIYSELVRQRGRRDSKAKLHGERPCWDDGGVLTFRGATRRLHLAKATNQAVVLAAFERAQWPTSINSPFTYTTLDGPQHDEARTRETVKSLNDKFHGLLKFFARGERIDWERAPQLQPEERI